MADIYDPNRGYVPSGGPGASVYDPVRGMVPVTPQQNYIEWLLSQLDPRNIDSRERMRNMRAQADRAAAAPGATGDPIIPPPMATGEQGYVAPVPPRESLINPITATPPNGAPGTPGSALAGPPAPVTAFGPTGAGGVLPPLDRDRALPPLQSPNSMTPTPPAMLGGNNYAASGLGPTGAIAGSSAQYPDETGRGIGSPAAGAPGGAGGLGGLNGPLPINTEAALKLYEDETGMALRQGFQDAGIDSFTNPYAQRVIKRYAPILGNLMDFFALAAGHDPEDTASMATWVPQFIKQFMSGAVNPQQLVQRALDIAEQNPVLKEYLLNTVGPNRLLAIQGQTSGYGDRVEGARQRVLQERIARQQMGELQNPATAKEDAWLAIVRGGGR